ncbi:MAG: hypothetical protein IJR63_09425 [Synergistaceae bacterium]|nr:hypothetical protein [Synergistaceae bacterium]
MAGDKVRMWGIWRPFDSENYRYAWRSGNILGVIRQLWEDVRCTYQRARFGYCCRDLWNIDAWFLDVMPRMLEEYRDTRHGSPVTDGTTEETCHEKWTKILDRMIFLFREASEDTCTRRNPYEAEYDRIQAEFTEKYGLLGEKLLTDAEKDEAEKRHGLRVHFANELPEYREMCDKYFDEDRKIADYRGNCKDEAFTLFVRYFHDLWD